MAVHQRFKPKTKLQRISNYVKTRPIQITGLVIVIILLIIYLFMRKNKSQPKLKQEIEINVNEPVLPFQETTEHILDAIPSKKYRYF
jgi:hypothetical protein